MAQNFNGNLSVDGDLSCKKITAKDVVIAGTKQLVRTATVVVGLESSGYTTGQVDVLIKPTDNVLTKLDEAMAKLPSFGGEIKFLEGTYIINSEVDIINNCKISGVGTATKIKGMRLVNTDNKKLSICDVEIVVNPQIQDVSFIYIGAGTQLVMNNVYNESGAIANTVNCTYATALSIISISNCVNVFTVNKTASNWRNIFVDGVSRYVALNSSVMLTTAFKKVIDVTPQIGDEIIVRLDVGNAGGRQTFILSYTQDYNKMLVAGESLTLNQAILWGDSMKIIVSNLVNVNAEYIEIRRAL